LSLLGRKRLKSDSIRLIVARFLKELGLGSRFLASVADASSRALAYPLTGTPASKNTRSVFLKDFPCSLRLRGKP
jgi:hypothetical protein